MRQLGFRLFYLIVRDLPQVSMPAVIFSPLQLVGGGEDCCWRRQVFVQVQALQQRVPGPSLSREEQSEAIYPECLALRWVGD